MVIAVDFDGTLFEEAFPDIGAPKMAVINYVKQKKAEGNKIILWTCRHGELLSNALEACALQGIVFDAVNENVDEKLQKYGHDSRKIGADLYIDDKSINPEVFK